jgi:hypothetical protein
MQMAMAAGLVLTGCGDSTTDGGTLPDMSVTTKKDMTMPGSPDMTTPPDMTVTAMPDMLVLPSGNVVLTDISATAIIQGNPVPVRVIAPLVGFSAGGMHDFSNMGLAGGCQGDHYTANKHPTPDVDSGTITITGYTGGNFLTGMAAPSKISCAIVNGYYKCGYGDLVNGMPGPDPLVSPYGGNSSPIDPTDMISFAGSGGTAIKAWNGMTDVKDAAKTMDNINTIKFDPKADYNLKFTCPTEAQSACGFTVVGVSVSFSDQTPQNYLNPPTNSGNFTCFGIAGSGALTLNKEAIAAAAGCDNTGANCDNTLVSQRVVVVRLDTPKTVMDANGASIKLFAGRGDSAISAK